MTLPDSYRGRAQAVGATFVPSLFREPARKAGPGASAKRKFGLSRYLKAFGR